MKKLLWVLMLIGSSTIFADEAPKSQGGGYMQSLIMILLAIVFFYFILWRPEQKRRKKQTDLRNSLKAGDRVTAMGILGTVDSVSDKTVVIKTVDGSKIEMLKMAISEIQSDEINKENK